MKLVVVAGLALTVTASMLATNSEPARRLSGAAVGLLGSNGSARQGYSAGSAREGTLHRYCAGLKTGGFIVGGKYGKGYLSCRNRSGSGLVGARHSSHRRRQRWFSDRRLGDRPDHAGDVGHAARTNSFRVSSRWALKASVAAGPVGRTATAQTDAQMHAEILSWSRSQGLFAGLALEGATLREDLDDNAALYGKKLENRDIVTNGTALPRSAAALIDLLNKYSARERVGKKR